MIDADNLFAMAFVLSGLAFFGFWIDGTELGKKTSGVVWIILLGVLFSNTGIIPAKSQAYDFVGGVGIIAVNGDDEWSCLMAGHPSFVIGYPSLVTECPSMVIA